MKRSYIIAALIGAVLLYSFTRKKKMSNFKKKLIDLANAEYTRWNTPTKIKEGEPRTMAQIENYYTATTNLKGQKAIDTAWSASFNSWLMKQAGAGKNFNYNASHSAYIQTAKQNRANKIKTIQAFKPQEIPVQVGDFICYPRQDGVTFETPGRYYSHCDIVTEIKDNKAIAIGGNVSNSVSKSTYTLDPNGKVLDKKVHAILKNYL